MMRQKMNVVRSHRYASIGAIALSAIIVAFCPARAQDAGPPPGIPAGGVPPTTVEPEGGPAAAPAPPAAAAPKAHRTTAHRTAVGHFDIEEANARLELRNNTPIYASPAISAHQIEQGTAGKYLQVTGVTRHWLRVKLKSGATGYVEQKDVRMMKPADKIFMLTKNAAVRAEANPWSKQLSEVHRGHNVHVVGIALNYVKIRMKSGLEGYIPLTALE